MGATAVVFAAVKAVLIASFPIPIRVPIDGNGFEGYRVPHQPEEKLATTS